MNEFAELHALAHSLTRLLETKDRLADMNKSLHADYVQARDRATLAEWEREEWRQKCAVLQATCETHDQTEAHLTGIITRLCNLVEAHEAITATLNIPPHTAAAIDLAVCKRHYTHLDKQRKETA